MRDNPCHEGECAQAGPDIIRKPKQHKSEKRHVPKEPIPRHRPAIGRPALLRLVQRAKQYRRRQARRPNQRGRIDKPPPRQAREAKPNHLRRQQEQEGEARAKVAAPVHGAHDGHERPRGVRGAGGDVDANDDQCVFLDAEAARVDVHVNGRHTAQWYAHAPPREAFPGTSEGEDEELGDDVADGEGRVTQGEELIGAGEDNHEERGEKPGAKGCD